MRKKRSSGDKNAKRRSSGTEERGADLPHTLLSRFREFSKTAKLRIWIPNYVIEAKLKHFYFPILCILPSCQTGLQHPDTCKHHIENLLTWFGKRIFCHRSWKLGNVLKW